MSFLTRDDILNANDLVVEEVEVPEWKKDGKVRVKALNGYERDRFEESMTQQKGKKIHMNMQNVRARLAAETMVDENNKPLFSPADVEALGRKSAAALGRVFDVAMRLAGMRDQDIEELTENFTKDQREGSTLD